MNTEIYLLTAAMLFAACATPVGEGRLTPTALPARTFDPLARDTAAPAHTSSPTQELTSTAPPPHTPIPEAKPTFTLPSDIYPSPVPLSGQAAWLDGQLCPNPAGLERADELPLETAREIIMAYFSGGSDTARRVSDPAHWGSMFNTALSSEQLKPDWFETPQPARAAPYAGMVEAQCGQEVLGVSWWVVYCYAPCNQPNRSASLANDFFLINRTGHWLVWFMYP
ncbi:MAG TPA: hypothetical protein VI793_22105 [Anaerolineales bacterium]|nr:hypothetical protein [Anaerolineales bacterium]